MHPYRRGLYTSWFAHVRRAPDATSVAESSQAGLPPGWVADQIARRHPIRMTCSVDGFKDPWECCAHASMHTGTRATAKSARWRRGTTSFGPGRGWTEGGCSRAVCLSSQMELGKHGTEGQGRNTTAAPPASSWPRVYPRGARARDRRAMADLLNRLASSDRAILRTPVRPRAPSSQPPGMEDVRQRDAPGCSRCFVVAYGAQRGASYRPTCMLEIGWLDKGYRGALDYFREPGLLQLNTSGR
jgi:hypothetical protein